MARHTPTHYDNGMNCRQESGAPIMGGRDTDRIVALRFAGQASVGVSAMQTLLTAFDPGAQPRLWIGLRGAEQKLTVIDRRASRAVARIIGTVLPSSQARSSTSSFSSTLAWDRAGSCAAWTMTIAGHRLPPRHPGEPSG